MAKADWRGRSGVAEPRWPSLTAVIVFNMCMLFSLCNVSLVFW